MQKELFMLPAPETGLALRGPNVVALRVVEKPVNLAVRRPAAKSRDVIDVECSEVKKASPADEYNRKRDALPKRFKTLLEQTETIQYSGFHEVKSALIDQDAPMAYANAVAIAAKFGVLLDRLKKAAQE